MNRSSAPPAILPHQWPHFEAIRDLLEDKYRKYNQVSFIASDPIKIPHLFQKKEDIEIAGFLAATIAWGNRKSILTNALKLVNCMDMSPHDFILHHSKKEIKSFEVFVHRTFNGSDCIFFIKSLRNLYLHHGGLEGAFKAGAHHNDQFNLKYNIMNFRRQFLQPPHQKRVEKHVSDPSRNSSAKRLCMFLRWMVRKDKSGVDFGLWRHIAPAELCLPLDVHTGNVSRSLGLLQRKQNDWRAVEEVTNVLRTMDADDPVKYDFALFGMGVDKETKNVIFALEPPYR